MRCQACQADVPETRHVTFYQNIGLLVLRFPSSVQGNICKGCIHHFFWKMTMVSMVAGWWGIISFITNCFFVINNIAQYIPCLFMQSSGPAQPATAATPTLYSHSADRITPFHQEIVISIEAGEPLANICERISDRGQ